MAALPPALQEELASLFLSLDGVERTRYLCIAATCVLLYDMLLTFDEEVEYFWKPGPWSLTRVLFFWNRYFPPVILIMCLYGLFGPNLSLEFCKGWIHSEFLLSIAGLAIVQAIIVLRICFVYSKDFVTRAFVVACFVACTIITLVIFAKMWHDVDPVAIPVPGLKLNGCTAPQSQQIWKIFIPNLALHTLLYLATSLPPLRMRRIGKKSQLLDRLAMDGGIFYFSVFAIAMFTTVGALDKSPLRLTWDVSALLGIAAASVSRLMLSIRSLAARLSINPDWLLNNTELSRVNWKYGRNGELIVEINRDPDDLELSSMDDDMPREKRSDTPAVYTTRVGVLEDVVYPGTRDYKAPPRPKKTTKVTFQENRNNSRDSCDV
ncbi:hypothetical protein FKP32DRAFT_1601265 [Trametes sanguinea]|nr:hypothetical protein FKP32DRAFT_1601265 [Trametes sanguinea]